MLIRLRTLGANLKSRLTIPPDIRWGGIRALEIAVWSLVLLVTVATFMTAASVYNFLALLLGVAIMLAVAGIIWLGLRLVAGLNRRLLWVMLLFAVVTLPFTWLGATLYGLVIVFALAVTGIGCGVVARRRELRSWLSDTALALGIAVLGVLTTGLVLNGWQVEEDIVWEPMQGSLLRLNNPATPGQFGVSRFTYGPGNGPRGDGFGQSVSHVTEPVDGSKLLAGWDGPDGWARSAFWDADAETLPVRGQVWMPEGDGPFPLVLIVHGNHAMEDFSDGGYAYLGELFASRGSITASVDQNFFNLSTSSLLGLFDGGLEEENDARGWMLLEHVRQFRDWNADPDHPLYGLVDLNRVVLIGHSRGGEAVSEAAVFNRLSHYPDDATLEFDYNFGIQGVIAIAPVDHQYHPRDFDTAMRDVNYLVIHGSHDSDVNSYAGYAAFSRIVYDNCANCFRAGFYLIGANHGQFNTSWGRYDIPAPFDRFLNIEPLMDGVDQRAVAQVLFSAFLEATVHGRPQYRQLVAAPERQHNLFGESTRYLSQYRGADDQVVADFEEDADTATASIEGARIVTSGLTLWREADLSLKWRTADNAMALVGWRESGARYEVTNLPVVTEGAQTLSVTLALSDVRPGDDESADSNEEDAYEVPERIDFHIEIADAQGHVARLPISARRALLPLVKPVMYKLPGLDADAPSEIVMQRYRFALDEFVPDGEAFDPSMLSRISLVFDITDAGSVWLDDLTLSRHVF